LCVYYNKDAVKFVAGKLTKGEYLALKERTFPVAEFVNKNTPPNSIIIVSGEPRVFYFNRNIILYNIWEMEAKKDLTKYIAELKAKSIPVYLLYRNDVACRLLTPLVIAKSPVFTMKREVNEGETATYFLYQL
jgi:hypothetical protein